MTDEELIDRVAMIARHAHAVSNGHNHGGIDRAETYWRLLAPDYKRPMGSPAPRRAARVLPGRAGRWHADPLHGLRWHAATGLPAWRPAGKERAV